MGSPDLILGLVLTCAACAVVGCSTMSVRAWRAMREIHARLHPWRDYAGDDKGDLEKALLDVGSSAVLWEKRARAWGGFVWGFVVAWVLVRLMGGV